jgi:hypothetical protein
MRGKMGSRNELIYLFLTVCFPDLKKLLMAFIFLTQLIAPVCSATLRKFLSFLATYHSSFVKSHSLFLHKERRKCRSSESIPI